MWNGRGDAAFTAFLTKAGPEMGGAQHWSVSGYRWMKGGGTSVDHIPYRLIKPVSIVDNRCSERCSDEVDGEDSDLGLSNRFAFLAK